MGKSGVIIDNWTIELAVDSLRNAYIGTHKINDELKELVEAIVLWDEIFYIDTGKQYFWINEDDEISRQLNRVLHEKKVINLPYNLIPSDVDEKIGKSALEYYFKANYNGFGYLAVKQRAEFLKNYCLDSNYVPLRKRLVEYFDDNYIKNWIEANKTMSNNPIVVNSIFDWVVKRTKSPFDLIDTAIELRNDKVVKKFKRAMNDLENMRIGKQDKEINLLLNDISKMFNEKALNKSNIIFQLSVFPPGFTLKGESSAKLSDIFHDTRIINFIKLLNNSNDNRRMLCL